MEKLSAYNCPLWESTAFRNFFGPHHLFVNWIDVCETANVSTDEWCDDEDDNLELVFSDDKEWAFQRDFVGTNNGNHINIFCPLNFDDSFFNAIRWFLPRHLVNFGGLVIHSSAFVSQKGNAHLFVGPSGVGKTTTVTRIVGHTILGDDMILISNRNGQPAAETPVLGQNPRFAGRAGTRFPLEAIHFLCQGSEVQKRELAKLEVLRRLSTSILYPTWTYESENNILKIRSLLEAFIQQVPCDELTLDTSTPFLGVIDESYN